MRTPRSLPLMLIALLALVPGAAWSDSDTIPANHRYALYLDGQFSGFFTEVSGLGSEHEVVEYREGSDSGEVIRKLPGPLRYDNIVLKRGLIRGNTDWWDWRQAVITDGVAAATHDGAIELIDRSNEVVARWNFENAWPVKITGPQLPSSSNDVAIEELTIAHEYIERVQ